MIHFCAHVYRRHTIFVLSIDTNRVTKEINATRASWSQWFQQGKAFTTVDSRSYAQVVASAKSTSCTKSTRSWENHKTLKCNPVVRSLVKRTLVNKVVNDTLYNVKESMYQPSVTKTLHSAKPPEINTVTHNRFQVLADPHNTSTEVLLQNILENDTSPPLPSPKDRMLFTNNTPRWE